MEPQTVDNETYMNWELLRFTTAGSVDDGKSTLIGRLLYDSKAIFEDQYEAIEHSSRARGEEQVNLALLTDGLRAEREQGITIDVAYRYFATPRRKFIIADTPGHIQYTRNMVTGASTANLALILVDARKGVIEQTCRHAVIASLLKIPHVVLCVNKMDLVDYRQETFEAIRKRFEEFTAELDLQDIHAIPISALQGDNVVDRSARMPWYQGPTLLYLLETIHIAGDQNHLELRFPVQYVIRPQSQAYHDFRGYAGRIAGGQVQPGQEVRILPTGLSSRVRTVESYEGAQEVAGPPQSVALTLEDDIDIGRGDMIVDPLNEPEVTREVDAMLCWFSEKPLQKGGRYLLQHTTRTTQAVLKEVHYKLNINTLEKETDEPQVRMNDIASITVRTAQPICVDKYRRNRQTGSFILIDEATNGTVAACMIG
ncbi:MAG: sulfate adenylyltransferase subunit CysN [Spirochaetales bacterium]|nr:sulfate adenylyltransferase subunit CysN [Spirochaetales bacterium]